MKAYVKQPDGGKKSLEILEEMNDQCRNGNIDAKPDSRAIAVAIDACTRSGLTLEAARLVNQIHDSGKTQIMFNTIMTGYKDEGRGHETEAVLRRMIELSDAGYTNCSPDFVSYGLCIDAVSVMYGYCCLLHDMTLGIEVHWCNPQLPPF